MATRPCPLAPDYRKVLLGTAPAGDEDRLAQHLEHCEPCAAIVNNLMAEMDLATEISALPEALAPAEVTLVDSVIAQLQAQPAPGPETDAGSHTESLPLCGVRLEPPQAAEELGRLGPYRVLQLLGAGGMGVVFLAEDPQLRRRVALKILKPALAARPGYRVRFLREAQATAALEHPRIVPIYQVGEAGGSAFLAMQFLHGETLEARLDREGRLPVAEVLRLGREVAAGLAAAHDRGLVHRDIKPGNIFLEQDAEHSLSPRVKILDFGLALAPAEGPNLTDPAVVLGTPGYMAPEQAWGQGVDARTDLYGLGMVLYQMAAGAPAFAGLDTAAWLSALSHGPRRPLREARPEMPVELSTLVERLLAPNPADRPRSAREVDATLDAIAVGRPRRRRWQGWVAAALVASLGLLAGGIYVRIKDPSGKETVLPVAPGGSVQVEKDGQVVTHVAADPPMAAHARPFVRLRNGAHEEFATAAEAVAGLKDEDIIEVRGNGPFPLNRLRLTDCELTLRAAPGYRPVFVPGPSFAAMTAASRGFWVEVTSGKLHLEGCDFRNPYLALGMLDGGGSWEVRNCCFLSASSLFLNFNGSRAVLSENLIALGSYLWSMQLGPKVELEMSGNVVRSNNAYPLIIGRAPGGQRVLLQSNTFVLKEALFGQPSRDYPGFDIQAAGNLVWPLGPHVESPQFLLKDQFGWHGRQNLYVGKAARIFWNTDGQAQVSNLAGWQQYWGKQEEGSRETEQVVLGWEERGRQDPDAARTSLEGLIGTIRRKHPQLMDLGPRWDQVGPGPAYWRALEASGSRPPKRPAAPLDEPFMLVRGGSVVRAFSRLHQAVDAAITGDVIELHTDGPLPAVLFGDQVTGLTLRAVPGYRPVVEESFHALAGARLTVEGLHFRTVLAARPGIVRLAHCSCDVASQAWNLGSTEIDHCLLPVTVKVVLPADRPLVIRQSLIGGLGLFGTGGPDQQLELDHCVIWAPGPSAALETLLGGGKVAVSAQATLFEGGGNPTYGGALFAGAYGPALARWTGTGNAYCFGLRVWAAPHDPDLAVGLQEWRRRWNSDADSVEADPLEYDPRTWQIQSPVLKGQSFGADVRKVAVTAPTKK